MNNVNTLVHVPDDIGDEEATLIVTAGTAMYALDTLGGLIACKAMATAATVQAMVADAALAAEPRKCDTQTAWSAGA